MSSSSSAPRLPLSPASPPETGIKEQPKYHHSSKPTQTLPSPPHMSVVTERYVSSYGNQHSDKMATRSPTENFQQSSHRSNTATNAPQQTNSLKRPLPQDDEERPISKRQKKDFLGDNSEVDTSIIATNHDRKVSQTEDRTSERSMNIESDKSLDQKNGIFRYSQSAMELFDKITGEAFRLRTSTVDRPPINMSKHILGTYGLGPLLETVARYDPKTMEKINKLRKSYEGQIKVAQLSGRNKSYAAPKDPNDKHDPPWGPLRVMADKSANVWAEETKGVGIGEFGGLRDQLDKALKLNPGIMNKSTTQEWDDILGHELKKPGPPPNPSQSFQQAVQIHQPRLPNGVRPVLNAAGLPDKMRTRGKKRSYDDSSFSGYQGYADGHSEPDDNQSDRDGTWADRRKRKKD